MIRPPCGLCMPCTLHRVRDGDTIEVIPFATGLMLALRLIDCWCPDDNPTINDKASLRAVELLRFRRNDPLHYYVPFDYDELAEAKEKGRPINPFDLPTFDRVPAYLFLTYDTTLNEILVMEKLASTTKKGVLGA